jgi:hypothetical protein
MFKKRLITALLAVSPLLTYYKYAAGVSTLRLCNKSLFGNIRLVKNVIGKELRHCGGLGYPYILGVVGKRGYNSPK